MSKSLQYSIRRANLSIFLKAGWRKLYLQLFSERQEEKRSASHAGRKKRHAAALAKKLLKAYAKNGQGSGMKNEGRRGCRREMANIEMKGCWHCNSAQKAKRGKRRVANRGWLKKYTTSLNEASAWRKRRREAIISYSNIQWLAIEIPYGLLNVKYIEMSLASLGLLYFRLQWKWRSFNGYYNEKYISYSGEKTNQC